MALRYVYIVRHGQYQQDDLSDKSSNDIDGSLSELGVQQALRTADALKHLPIETIHVSSMRRTQQTAQPIIDIFPDAQVHESDRLREAIPFVSDSLAIFFNNYPQDLLEQNSTRAREAFEHYFRPNTSGRAVHEVLVTHSNLLRYFVCRALNVDPAAWIAMQNHNCGITYVTVDYDGYCMLYSYNDTGHLTPQMRTNNFEG